MGEGETNGNYKSWKVSHVVVFVGHSGRVRN